MWYIVNNYLIPANSKNGKLILGIFRPGDLVLLITGVTISILIMALIPISSTFETILALLPGCISGFLVIPVPNYHNMLNIIVIVYRYYNDEHYNRYVWRGWCYKEWQRKK